VFTEEGVEFSKLVAETTDSVFVWGEDRTASAVAAFAIVRRAGRPFLWLDVRGASDAEDAYEPLLGPRVAADRRYIAHRQEELRPERGTPGPSSWATARSSRRGGLRDDLVDFLALPRTVQVLAARLITIGRRSTLFVTNVDRFGRFYPEDRSSTGRYVGAIRRHGIKLVVAFCGGARSDRFAFGHVLRVEPGVAQGWRGSVLRCEQGTMVEGADDRTTIGPTEIDSVRLLASEPVEPAADASRPSRTEGELAGAR
jgi:hypothetical protein